MAGKKVILIERIKSVIEDMISFNELNHHANNSEYIGERLQHDYNYLSNIFSEGTGNTIEHFIINKKIEVVKKLLVTSDLDLTQIADKLHYSSVGHLSGQFKKVTGYTPTSYKKRMQKGAGLPEKNKK